MGLYCYSWCTKTSYLGFDESGTDLDWLDRARPSAYVDFLDWKGVRIDPRLRLAVVVYLPSHERFLPTFRFCGTSNDSTVTKNWPDVLLDPPTKTTILLGWFVTKQRSLPLFLFGNAQAGPI